MLGLLLGSKVALANLGMQDTLGFNTLVPALGKIGKCLTFALSHFMLTPPSKGSFLPFIPYHQKLLPELAGLPPTVLNVAQHLRLSLALCSVEVYLSFRASLSVRFQQKIC